MTERNGLIIILTMLVILLTGIAVRNCETITECVTRYDALEKRVFNLEYPIIEVNHE